MKNDAVLLQHQAGRGLIPDDEGSELADMEAVLAEAFDAARELMATAIRKGVDVSNYAFEITDEDGNMAVRVPFRTRSTPGAEMSSGGSIWKALVADRLLVSQAALASVTRDFDFLGAEARS